LRKGGEHVVNIRKNITRKLKEIKRILKMFVYLGYISYLSHMYYRSNGLIYFGNRTDRFADTALGHIESYYPSNRKKYMKPT
jgi:hypothetical protein